MRNLVLILIWFLGSQAHGALRLEFPLKRELKTPTYVDRFLESRRCKLSIKEQQARNLEQEIVLSGAMFSSSGVANFSETGVTGRSVRVQIIRIDENHLSLSLYGKKDWHADARQSAVVRENGLISLSIPFGGSSLLELNSQVILWLDCEM